MKQSMLAREIAKVGSDAEVDEDSAKVEKPGKCFVHEIQSALVM